MGANRSLRRKVLRSMGGTRAIRVVQDAERVRRGEQPHFFRAAPPAPLDPWLLALWRRLVAFARRFGRKGSVR